MLITSGILTKKYADVSTNAYIGRMHAKHKASNHAKHKVCSSHSLAENLG